jgi:GMP synthase-like glutamine amidotransferase
MILVINICKHDLHYDEFVRPVEDVVKLSGEKFKVIHYRELKDFSAFDKVIICGTSLKDNDFLENLDRFSWIKDFSGSVLGICAGFQIVGLVYGGSLRKKTEIGFYNENFSENFLGVEGPQEVYHLHNNYVEFTEDFKFFTSGKIAQAVKHRKKDVYGVLFHPEVRQKKIISEFCKL